MLMGDSGQESVKKDESKAISEASAETAQPPTRARFSLKAELPRAVVTSSMAVLILPLTVALTYFFTVALQSPKPSIEEHSVIFYYHYVRLDLTLADILKKNPNVAVHLRQAILEKTNGDSDCVRWMKDLYLDPNCGDHILDALVEIADQARAAATTPLPPGLSTPNLDQIITREIHAIETIEGAINVALEVKLTDRMGDLEIGVGVYNAGSSDGVIKSLATLIFDGKKLTLGAKTWTPVKSHSFENVTFSTSTTVAGEEAILQELQNRVKKHEEISGTFEIDMSGKKTHTDITLPSKD